MAKADGSVAADEVKAFQEAFKVSAALMKQVAPAFNSAKRDAVNFEACAEQLVTLFKGNRKLLEDVLDGLFHIAKADGEVRRQEEQFPWGGRQALWLYRQRVQLNQGPSLGCRQAQSL